MPIGLCFVHSFSLYKVFKLHYFSLDFLFAGSLKDFCDRLIQRQHLFRRQLPVHALRIALDPRTLLRAENTRIHKRLLP